MVIKLIPAVLSAMIMVFSCTEDNETNVQSTLREESGMEDVTSNIDSTFQGCDSVYITTYHGTACCVSGPTQAAPGDTVTYHYQINHKDPKMSWEIRDGDITIIKGQDAPTVTVRFGQNFTAGVIGCVGSGVKDGTRLECSARSIVRTP